MFKVTRPGSCGARTEPSTKRRRAIISRSLTSMGVFTESAITGCFAVFWARHAEVREVYGVPLFLCLSLPHRLLSGWDALSLLSQGVFL